MVTQLPPHLRGERSLAEHFESMGFSVESVSVCREVDLLTSVLDARTAALLKLEEAWVKYVGNPSTVESYDPSVHAAPPLIDIDSSGLESQSPRFVIPHRPRPTLRPGYFRRQVDAIEYLENKFREADEEVQKRRKLGKFKATHAAFVTFEQMSSAVSFHFLIFRCGA
jgi:calcium permeable stress-gated cation channel